MRPSAEIARADRRDIGFPLLIKAAAGGGGRGMRRVDDPAELEAAVAAAAREARAGLRRRLGLPGAAHRGWAPYRGAAARRQTWTRRGARRTRLLDAASPPEAGGGGTCAGPGTRSDGAAAPDGGTVVASSVGLRNAATAEFLYAPDGAFYFLEVNARLQVEHGVTELVSGLDLVRGAAPDRRGRATVPGCAVRPPSTLPSPPTTPSSFASARRIRPATSRQCPDS